MGPWQSTAPRSEDDGCNLGGWYGWNLVFPIETQDVALDTIKRNVCRNVLVVRQNVRFGIDTVELGQNLGRPASRQQTDVSREQRSGKCDQDVISIFAQIDCMPFVRQAGGEILHRGQKLS